MYTQAREAALTWLRDNLQYNSFLSTCMLIRCFGSPVQPVLIDLVQKLWQVFMLLLCWLTTLKVFYGFLQRVVSPFLQACTATPKFPTVFLKKMV